VSYLHPLLADEGEEDPDEEQLADTTKVATNEREYSRLFAVLLFPIVFASFSLHFLLIIGFPLAIRSFKRYFLAFDGYAVAHKEQRKLKSLTFLASRGLFLLPFSVWFLGLTFLSLLLFYLLVNFVLYLRLGLTIMFRGNTDRVQVHLNSCHAGYNFFLSCLLWTSVPFMSGLPSLIISKNLPSPFFRIVHVGYFVMIGLVFPLVWNILDFVGFESLLSYPPDIETSWSVWSLQIVIVSSIGIAAVALVVKIGVLVYLFVRFYQAEAEVEEQHHHHLDFATFYSFVSSPAGPKGRSMITSLPSPAEGARRLWRYSVLFGGLNIIIGFTAFAVFINKSIASDFIILDFLLLTSNVLSLITGALILPVELSGVALGRAPRWLRGVFGCFLFCLLAPLPLSLFGGAPFDPCWGNRSPFTMGQLDILESCSQLGSLFVDDHTVADLNMTFEATMADRLSFSSNSVVEVINFPHLLGTESLNAVITISGNENLEMILFAGSVANTNRYFVIDISSNPALTLINFASFYGFESSSGISDNPNLKEIDLSNLNYFFSFVISGNHDLGSLSFPALRNFGGTLIITGNPNLQSLSFPLISLQRCPAPGQFPNNHPALVVTCGGGLISSVA